MTNRFITLIHAICLKLFDQKTVYFFSDLSESEPLGLRWLTLKDFNNSIDLTLTDHEAMFGSKSTQIKGKKYQVNCIDFV